MGLLNGYFDIDGYSEDTDLHRDTSEEISFFRSVCNGDIDAIYKNIEDKRFLDQEGVGKLSRDPVQNLKYHLVITAAIIARLCIEKGLEPERSYRMSDYYIKMLDNALTEGQVEEIHNRMVLDFTGKMRLLKKDKGISRSVTKCIDYIYSHINERITIARLAENSNVSTSFLSRQFNKEIGIPISDYIREIKIEMAQEKLINSNDSILDIAMQLSFSSQSHFIQAFKKVTGTTPRKFREQNSGKKWELGR